MFYQTNLIQRLHDHDTRLANARISNDNTQLASFMRFVRNTPYIAAILAQLETEYPDVGTDDVPGGTSSFALSRMPEDQGETAKVVWSLVLQCVDGGYKDMPFQTGFEISTFSAVKTVAISDKASDRHWFTQKIMSRPSVISLSSTVRRSGLCFGLICLRICGPRELSLAI